MNDLVNDALVERNRLSDWEDLTLEQRAFAHEYLSNGYDHRAAAQSTGYSPNNGIRLLRHPLVVSFIRHLQDEQYNQTLLTKSFVEAQYLDIIPKLRGEVDIPMVTGQGEEIMARKFHSAELVGVLRDLTKVTGMQADLPAAKGAVNVQINVGAMRGESIVVEQDSSGTE